MSDLVSRQEAIKQFCNQCKGRNEPCEHRQSCETMKVLKSLTSADRPAGKWEIKTEADKYGLKRPKLVCSKCEKEPAAWDLTELFEFCPDCGAMMNGGEEE